MVFGLLLASHIYLEFLDLFFFLFVISTGEIRYEIWREKINIDLKCVNNVSSVRKEILEKFSSAPCRSPLYFHSLQILFTYFANLHFNSEISLIFDVENRFLSDFVPTITVIHYAKDIKAFLMGQTNRLIFFCEKKIASFLLVAL